MLLVVGSIAFDTVKTPFGSRDRMLGGSATHFALAAGYFTDVRIVGVVGEDFGNEHLKIFKRHGVDTSDIERVENEKTFFWSGEYGYDLNDRTTHDTQLNVFEKFQPKLSAESRAAQTVFLGNIQPELQQEVRSQCDAAQFVALDSMNLWIDTARSALVETTGQVDVLMINDAELRQLTGKPNLLQAAREVFTWGPQAVVAKQGEYGAALFTKDNFFSLPGYPLETVLDPTGAGDTFAGGFLGYLDAHRTTQIDEDLLRRAMTYGSVMASYNVEDFGTERVQSLTMGEINDRFRAFKQITHFEEIPLTKPVTQSSA